MFACCPASCSLLAALLIAPQGGELAVQPPPASEPQDVAGDRADAQKSAHPGGDESADLDVDELTNLADSERVLILRTLSPDEVLHRLHRTEAGFNGLFRHGPVTGVSKYWRKLNHWLDEKAGVRLGLAYTALYQGANAAIGDDEASGGDLDFFGRWLVIDTDEGARGQLGFHVEQRDAFTDTAPADLNESIGSIWRTTRGFGEFSLRVRELWWSQSMLRGKIHLRAGVVNQKHFVDIYTFKSQNFFFQSTPLSDSPTIAFPNHGIGGMLRVSPNQHFHMTAALGDVNGKGRTGSGSLDNGLYTAVDVSWTPSSDDSAGKYGVTLWHTDENDDNVPSGQGISFVAEHEFKSGRFVFGRYGHGDGAGLDIARSAALGVARLGPFNLDDDSTGIAVTWARPADSSLEDQWGGEAYYALHLTPAITISPGLQAFVNPVGNPDEDVIGLVQIRVRVEF